MNWGTTQAGSSMLELISMMTLAGFAMASAAPALVSLEDAAFDAKIDGAISALHSANYQAHASWLFFSSQHQNVQHVRMENTDIVINQGWIDIESVATAAGISCESYGCVYGKNTATFLATAQAEENIPCIVYAIENGAYTITPRLSWDSNLSECN